LRNAVKILLLMSLLSVTAFAQGGNPFISAVNWASATVNTVVDAVCGLIIVFSVLSGVMSVRAGLGFFGIAIVVVYLATHNQAIVNMIRGI
jgi:hypothetical protein